MKKLFDDPLRFAVSLKEVIKYGLSPHNQLIKYPKAKILFKRKKKTKGGKINVCKRNNQKK